MDASKHTDVCYSEDSFEIRKMVNQKRFKALRKLSREMYEVEFGKRVQTIKIPIYLGFHILNMAKLRMNAFYFDFLMRYLNRELFNTILTDTDSLGLNLGRMTIDECVLAENQNAYTHLRKHWCKDSGPHPDAFLTRTCCEKHQLYDSREPGLFKIEVDRAVVAVALSPKCYVLGFKDHSLKLTTKGIADKARAINSPLQTFKAVMRNHSSHTVTNRGFMQVAGEMRTYSVDRVGLNYAYFKRQVLSNGYHTKTLPLTLKPHKKAYICLSTDYPDLSPFCCKTDYMLSYLGGSFPSILHALTVFKLYRAHSGESHNQIAGELEEIFSMQNERGLMEKFANIKSDSVWLAELETLIFTLISIRVKAHPSLLAQIRSCPNMNFVYATQFSHQLGNGQKASVTRFCPLSQHAGNNFIGRAYDKLKACMQPDSISPFINPLNV